MSRPTTFDEFLSSDAVVALRSADAPALPETPHVVDGTAMTDLAGVYSQFATAWAFPDYFGRNKDAFDDCMRDLAGSPLITEITDAQRLLLDEPRQLRWFAAALEFYARSYRAQEPAVRFAVVLSAPADLRATVARRWRAVDVEPIRLGD